MTKFSQRHRFNPNSKREPILTDAPKLLRSQYLKRVLFPICYMDGDARYHNTEGRPLAKKQLYVKLCTHFIIDEDSAHTDSWQIDDILENLILSVEWYAFYDVVEFVGIELEKAVLRRESEDESWHSLFGTESYIRNTNEVFTDLNVCWKMNSEGQLEKSEEIDFPIQVGESENEKIWEVIRGHLNKAKGFCSPVSLDPENSIKEAISAIESFGKFYLEGTKTLGDVIKVLKRTAQVPEDFIYLVSKLYEFSNKTPGIRHGGVSQSDLDLYDAEYILNISVSVIKYLNNVINKRAESEPIQE